MGHVTAKGGVVTADLRGIICDMLPLWQISIWRRSSLLGIHALADPRGSTPLGKGWVNYDYIFWSIAATDVMTNWVQFDPSLLVSFATRQQSSAPALSCTYYGLALGLFVCGLVYSCQILEHVTRSAAQNTRPSSHVREGLGIRPYPLVPIKNLPR